MAPLLGCSRPWEGGRVYRGAVKNRYRLWLFFSIPVGEAGEGLLVLYQGEFMCGGRTAYTSPRTPSNLPGVHVERAEEAK